MTLIAFGSAKGSPGVTTAAVALAAVWPVAAVLADCDPAGGDVALRLTDPNGAPLWRDRGLVALAAVASQSRAPVMIDIDEYLQSARGGMAVLAGVESAAQATAIAPAWPLIGQQLRVLATRQTVLADCGRLDPSGSSAPVWRQADLLVLCTRPRPDSLLHLRHTLQALRDVGPVTGDAVLASGGAVPPVAVVVIEDGSTRDAVDQVRAALQVQRSADPASRSAGSVAVAGGLAHDPTGAAGLAGTPTRRLDRCPLIRSARILAPLLADLAATASAAPAAAPLPSAHGHPEPVMSRGLA